MTSNAGNESHGASSPRTNTLALVGFIGAFVIPLVGIVLGILARRQLDAPGNQDTGRGLARWALVIGIIGTVLQTTFFIVWCALFFSALSGNFGEMT
ncbi:MAG: DUF4190 domain-containing protein [Actinomycetota bacterium]